MPSTEAPFHSDWAECGLNFDKVAAQFESCDVLNTESEGACFSEENVGECFDVLGFAEHGQGLARSVFFHLDGGDPNVKSACIAKLFASKREDFWREIVQIGLHLHHRIGIVALREIFHERWDRRWREKPDGDVGPLN